MDQNTRYQLNKGVILDRICGLDLMISTCSRQRKGSYLILNEDSLFLAKHIQAGETLKGIIQAIMHDYESDYQQAKATAEQFLRTLMRHGFIKEMARS